MARKKYYCIICTTVEVLRKTKYCKPCNRNKSNILVNCAECGISFMRQRSEVHRRKNSFCGFPCRNIGIAKRQSGDNSWLWRGGKTSEDKRLRNSYLVANWRKEVFKRDNYTCQICLKPSSKLPRSSLTADHIQPWSLFPELRFDLDNGRTLCLDCHRKTDTWGYKMYAKIRAINSK